MLSRIQRWLQSPEYNKNSKDLSHHLQLAAAVLLIEVSTADFEKSREERSAILDILKTQYALSTDELDELWLLANETADQTNSLHQFTRLLNEKCTYEERVYLIEQLWCVAYVDGRIDKYEDYIIRKLADLLYIAHKDFVKGKLKAEKRYAK